MVDSLPAELSPVADSGLFGRCRRSGWSSLLVLHAWWLGRRTRRLRRWLRGRRRRIGCVAEVHDRRL